MVHQHFMLVEPFTVLENVILGAESGALLRPSLAKARAELKRLEEEYELEVDPDAVVGELSVGLQQRVEILKALYRECDILILDEPTGVLTPAEADHLFRILEHLKAEGKTIILITHKLREIMAITDDGQRHAPRRDGEDADDRRHQPGRARRADGRPPGAAAGREDAGQARAGLALEVENLSLTDDKGVARLKSVSFAVRAGEILGIAGVAGNGQSELLEVLAGMRPATSGTVRLNGKPLDLSRSTNADDRRGVGIAHVPEDRHRRGLVMPFAEWENSFLGYQDEERFDGPVFTLDRDAIRDLARDSIERFDIRPPSCDLKTANFSGGNQQKIVLAREMERDPEVLLVGQPTRGVDIGAIEFIHQQIVALRDKGKAIILVSVELDEIQALSDRIVVMFDGRISGERARRRHRRARARPADGRHRPGQPGGMRTTLPRWADLGADPGAEPAARLPRRRARRDLHRREPDPGAAASCSTARSARATASASRSTTPPPSSSPASRSPSPSTPASSTSAARARRRSAASA